MNRAPAATILVLEDCDEDFETVLDAARLAGVTHNFRRVTTGDECIAILRDCAQAVAPVLVLLDLNTPQGDGREALRYIKEHERLRSVPLVVLTTSANPRDLDFCYDCGANAYHVKPVRHNEHLRVLEEIFYYWLRAVALPQEQEALTWKGNSPAPSV